MKRIIHYFRLRQKRWVVRASDIFGLDHRYIVRLPGRGTLDLCDTTLGVVLYTKSEADAVALALESLYAYTEFSCLTYRDALKDISRNLPH